MKTWNKVFIILFTLLLLLSTPLPIHADIGPKPSVTVTINGATDEVYYATLLSKYESTGPESAYRGDNPQYTIEDEEYDIWKAFVDYQDEDGFYFLQIFWDCSEKDMFRWGYYPPQTFKVLLYFPNTNEFVVSEIHERYAFDSYFTMDIDAQIETNYNYTWETISLISRIILTILIEILLAWLLNIRSKKDLKIITIVNIITQVILNIALNAVNFYKGQWAFVFYYAILEIAILLIEAIIYNKFNIKKATIYAMIANIVSFGLGLWLAHIIPGIF